jgi:hypothetical protein
MKLIVAVIALFFSSLSFSQSLIGRWKPVFVTMDSLMRGDVEQDTIYINPSLKENFKDDKDPQASEQMIQMLFRGMIKSMKDAQEEYFENGDYTETNTKTNRIKKGSYKFDQQNKILKRTLPPVDKEQNFNVSWRNDLLVLTTELESRKGKKGKLEIVYKKL